MNAREYDHHRRVSRLLILDAVIMGACVLAVFVAGGLTYYATLSRVFSAITAALPH